MSGRIALNHSLTLNIPVDRFRLLNYLNRETEEHILYLQDYLFFKSKSWNQVFLAREQDVFAIRMDISMLRRDLNMMNTIDTWIDDPWSNSLRAGEDTTD